MNIRKANQERFEFWAEFCEDGMAALMAKGFSEETAIQLLSAIIGGKEIVWQTPPGYLSEATGGLH